MSWELQGIRRSGGNSDEIVRNLSDTVGEILQQDEVIKQMENVGMPIYYSDSVEFLAKYQQACKDIESIKDLLAE